MIRKSVTAKIGVAIMGLISVVLLVQYLALGQLLKNAFYGQAAAELLVQGQQYAQMSASGGYMMMQMLCTTANTSLVMLDKQGHIITASPALHLGKQSSADTETLRTALLGKSQMHSGYSGLFSQRGLMVAVPMKQAGDITGAVVLFRPQSIIQTGFQQQEWLLVLAGIGAVLMALGLTVVLSKRIAEPLKQMAGATRELGKGNFEMRLPVVGEDEVANLGESINELAKNLHRLETSRKEFLADISHELRTPMSYIRGYSQVLEEGLIQSPEETQKYLHIINEESKRLETLVNDLFVLAQADAGMLTVEKQSTQLENIVQQVVERMHKKAEDKQIQIHLEIPTLPTVYVDPLRMEQVLINLIDNAIRYTPAGGQIMVYGQTVSQGVEISISDTGIGIPKEDLPRIWDRLYRVEKSRSRARGGTGLGLAIVKQIVELHGGHVTAESVEGKGTTMRFWIPLDSGAGMTE
ncbi:HAMP domain-containing protein [Alicyclobacillus curvatus]|nr:HAMP domain-containing protein [Alicyclobacillus curvatus]